ncbi:DUF2480 family protein [Mangrovimonas sp. YM274]|uniref:DUF2480 family protein n=1 Tax=Mangrovimonas sp. YM274 TaxID=3070660 RepID=UPI0027DB4B47|nr:DUF2480 family protein [Mangrovimonas sp. YM274]WMI68778.1 DUF2480 family protein [Mangrovimonas sp. YM274]
MADEIINRVANSKLVTIDLEDFYPKGARVLFDIKDWLFQELILKEKDFREYVKQHDWSQYQDGYLALQCSAEAIIPSWAYLLIATQASSYAKKVVVGTLQDLESSIFQDIVSQLDVEQFRDKPVIIKGCSNKPIPETAYTLLVSRLNGVAKSIMFGEACSTVPLYKK